MRDRPSRYERPSSSRGSASVSRSGADSVVSARRQLDIARQNKEASDRAAGLLRGATVLEVEFIPTEGASAEDIAAAKANLELSGAKVVMRETAPADGPAAPVVVEASAEAAPVVNPLEDHEGILSATVDGVGNVTLVVTKESNIADPSFSDVAMQLSRAHGHDKADPTVTVKRAR